MNLEVSGREQTTTTDLIEQLRTIPREEKERNFQEELIALLEVMQKQKITGNEFFLLFASLRRYNFMGAEFQCALLGAKKTDGKTEYKRKICLKVKGKEGEESEDSVYLIDSSSLCLSQCTLEEIEEKIEDGECVWENPDYVIERS